MRVFLSTPKAGESFSDLLDRACRAAGLDIDSQVARGRPRTARGAASRLQQIAERIRGLAAQAAMPGSLASYEEQQRETPARRTRKPADPQAVADELCISAQMSLGDLNRLRRTFARANHPDRVGLDEREIATRRMMIANMLIDGEVKRRRAR